MPNVGSPKLIGAMVYSAPPVLRLVSTCCLPLVLLQFTGRSHGDHSSYPVVQAKGPG